MNYRFTNSNRLRLSSKRKRNRGKNLANWRQKKALEEKAAEARRNNPNTLEDEVISPDCGTAQALQLRMNDTPVDLDANITVPYIKQEIVDPVVSQTLPCHTLTQPLQFRVNNTPVRLDANTTLPYIKQEIVEPCHTLNQEIVGPVVSQTLPYHTLSESFPVESSSRQSKVINITERILPERIPIDLPYDTVCTERNDQPGSDVGRSANENNALAGKRFMTLGEVNCTSNKLHKTCFTYSSSQCEPKSQLSQSIQNSWKSLLIRPAVPNVSSHTGFAGELISSEKIKVEDKFEVVENEFHESPEAVISSLNQEKWNSSLSGSCLNPVIAMVARSPSTQWFMNSCTSAVTTETVTTFASTSDSTVCTSTSALSNACLSSTSTTPILVSSYAQPSIPSIQYNSSLPINPALNVPMTLLPPGPEAKGNSFLLTRNNQSPSMFTNLPSIANEVNNSSTPTRISHPSSNLNSSLPIQKLVINPTINSTLCDTNLSSTLGLPDNPVSVKVQNGLTLFDKDADFLSDNNNATLSGTNGTTLSDTKGTSLSDTEGTTLSIQNSTSLSDSISTTLCDRNSIYLSDRKNNTLFDRNINYMPDRNTTALLDSTISNVPEQNSTMLSNRFATVSQVGAPSIALSAQKSDSVTIVVSNDECTKEKKVQQILGEMADKLSKILPDTSFVKYLNDPDFYFFIGLMPLIHMLSLQQKVHARIMIKGILYDLAFPATSTSPVHSN